MAIPSNLLPVNTSDISGSIQSLAGQLPTSVPTEIPQFSVLNQILSDDLFNSDDFDQIRTIALNLATTYIKSQEVSIPSIPSIPTSISRFSPKLPSLSQVKNYINTKIDRIKIQKQRASIKSLNEQLKQKDNPFTYRKQLKNNSNLNAVKRIEDVTSRG